MNLFQRNNQSINGKLFHIVQKLKFFYSLIFPEVDRIFSYNYLLDETLLFSDFKFDFNRTAFPSRGKKHSFCHKISGFPKFHSESENIEDLLLMELIGLLEHVELLEHLELINLSHNPK